MTTLSTPNVPNVIPITSKLTMSITYVVVIQSITDRLWQIIPGII